MAVTLTPIPDIPMVRPGDDLAGLLIAACKRNALAPADGDVLVVAQKIVSKAEGRYVDLAKIQPSPRAARLAAQVNKDPRLVEVILRESRRVVRQRPGVLIVEHRLGFVMANAGVDRSNVDPAAGAEPVLLLPHDPDGSARTLLERLAAHFDRRLGVIISDSFGRAWRRVTSTGFADEIASAASPLMGQANEARPVVLVRGLAWSGPLAPAATLIRPA